MAVVHVPNAALLPKANCPCLLARSGHNTGGRGSFPSPRILLSQRSAGKIFGYRQGVVEPPGVVSVSRAVEIGPTLVLTY